MTIKQISSHENIFLELEKIEIEEINPEQAETLCCHIVEDLPEYFGILSANEQYFNGIRQCKNLAAKVENCLVPF